MLDGGIADSIPVQYALDQGYKNLVVILTRNKGYRKKTGKLRLTKAFYRKYPALQKAIQEPSPTESHEGTQELPSKLGAQ